MIASAYVFLTLLSQNPAIPECAGKAADDQQFCKAVQARDASQCEAIQDSQQRAYCQAVAGHNTKACGTITNGQLRGYCLKRASEQS